MLDIQIRLAKIDDLKQIDVLMKYSMQSLGIGFYSENQIDSSCQFVCTPDLQLIKDKTFFVVSTKTESIIGCGGWSFRNKLYAGPSDTFAKADKLNPLTDPARIRAMFVDPKYGGKGIGSLILNQSEQAAKASGFQKGALGATLSGLSFYIKKGWHKVSEETAILPDGIPIKVVQMEKYF